MKAIGAEVCLFIREILELLSSVCMSGVFTMNFNLLDHLVQFLRRFVSISAMDASAYKHFDIYINKAYQRSCRRRATLMQVTVRLTERYQRAERRKIRTKIGTR